MKTLIFLIVLIPFILNSQEKGTLKFDFNCGYQAFQMDRLNTNINDPSYLDTMLFKEFSTIRLDKGLSFNFGASYQPFRLFNIGLDGSYQFGSAERKFEAVLNQFDPLTPNEVIAGKRMHEVSAISFGITSEFLIHNLKSWKRLVTLKRLESVLNFKVGYAWSKMLWNDYFISNSEIIKREYKSNGLHLAARLKIGYTILRSPIFSTLGFSIGYQYLQTTDLKSREGAFFRKESNKTNLDFSGITAGLYLTVGK
jgi:hypothetical protein